MAMNTDSKALRKRLSEYVNRNATTPEQESDLAGKSLDYLDILQREESDAGRMDFNREKLNQEARFKEEDMAYKREADAADRAMKANIYNQDRQDNMTALATKLDAERQARRDQLLFEQPGQRGGGGVSVQQGSPSMEGLGRRYGRGGGGGGHGWRPIQLGDGSVLVPQSSRDPNSLPGTGRNRPDQKYAGFMKIDPEEGKGAMGGPQSMRDQLNNIVPRARKPRSW